MSSDALRSYIRTLRQERKVSQGALAERIGVAPRTYKAWETGGTKDIKAPFLVRAIRYLRGSFDQVAEISDNATSEEGAQMALDWLKQDKQPAANNADLTSDEMAFFASLSPKQRRALRQFVEGDKD